MGKRSEVANWLKEEFPEYQIENFHIDRINEVNTRQGGGSHMEHETPKIPSCGRIVHYFPVLPDVIAKMKPDYCKMLPALVVEASDLYANLVVFGMGSNPAESCYSVPHKSCVLHPETREPQTSYWDWPEIK